MGQESPIYLGPDVSMSQSGEIADRRGAAHFSPSPAVFKAHQTQRAGREACSLPGCC